MSRTIGSRIVGVALAIGLVVASCGSDGDTAAPVDRDNGSDLRGSPSEDGAAPETTDAPVADPEPAETEEPAENTAVTEPEPGGPERPAVTLAPVSAGPITVAPTECAFEGYDLTGPAGPESMALAGGRLFVAMNDSVVAYNLDAGPGCTAVLATELGDGGILMTDATVSTLSGNPAGRLLVTGVLGSTVFDTASGESFACDDLSGNSALSPDGSQAIGYFVGRGNLEQWELTDSDCALSSEFAIPGFDMDWIKWISYGDGSVLIGGQTPEVDDDSDVIVARYTDAGEDWLIGGGEPGEDDWFGWVHGMTTCGAYTCLINVNTDALALISDAGEVVANFDASELYGFRGWIEPIVSNPDGTAYLLISESVDPEEGEEGEEGEQVYFGYVLRLDVSG